jgi:hypothetical protein
MLFEYENILLRHNQQRLRISTEQNSDSPPKKIKLDPQRLRISTYQKSDFVQKIPGKSKNISWTEVSFLP